MARHPSSSVILANSSRLTSSRKMPVSRHWFTHCRSSSRLVAIFIKTRLTHSVAEVSQKKGPLFYRQHEAAGISSAHMPAGPTMPSFLERTRAAAKIIVIDFGFLGDSVHLV